MGLVVVLVGGSTAADESEWGVCGEDYGGVIHSSKVSQLDSLEVVIGLEVEGVAAEVGLPLARYFVETLGSQICGGAVFDTGGFEDGLEVLFGGEYGFLDVSEGVEYVKAERVL